MNWSLAIAGSRSIFKRGRIVWLVGPFLHLYATISLPHDFLTCCHFIVARAELTVMGVLVSTEYVVYSRIVQRKPSIVMSTTLALETVTAIALVEIRSFNFGKN